MCCEWIISTPSPCFNPILCDVGSKSKVSEAIWTILCDSSNDDYICRKAHPAYVLPKGAFTQPDPRQQSR